MSQRLNSFPIRALVGVSALLLSVSASQAQAQRSPFAGLAGTWGGPGVITLNTGVKEKIRCRSIYKVTEGAADLQLELRCASEAYKFELQSAVSHKDSAISGTWSEVTRGALGTISGTSKGNQISLRASSPIFSANLTVTTQGSQQTIAIQSPGSEISAVAITLNRGAK